MFFLQLKNELWKLFAKRRTYMGFAVLLGTQLLMVVQRMLLTSIRLFALQSLMLASIAAWHMKSGRRAVPHG